MDLMSKRVKKLDQVRNFSNQSKSSLLRQSFLKLLDVVLYFLGLSKSVIYSILFSDGCNYRSRCEKCSKEFKFKLKDKMNFGALKRRLNPFEKRDKKKNKPKYAVYVLDSPPTLPSKGEKIPAVVLKNTKEIAEIFPEPEENVNSCSRHTIKVDIHKDQDGKHTKFNNTEKGMGDFLNKHTLKPDMKQPIIEKSSDSYLVKNMIEETQELLSKGLPCPSSKTRDHKVFLGDSSERHQHKDCSNPILLPGGPSISSNGENCANDIVKQFRELSFTRDSFDNESIESSSKGNLGYVSSGMSGDNKCNCAHQQPSIEKKEPDYTKAATDNEIVATAFRHAIIPEKMQQEECNLAESIRKSYDVALAQQRENIELTDSIPNISPVIENLKSRQQAGRDNILKKSSIDDLAMEAAFIVRECEQIENTVSFYIKTTTNSCNKDSLKALTTSSILVNGEMDASLKFLRRLREYIMNKDKLSSIVVFKNPVERTLNATIRKVINCIKTLKVTAEATDKRIHALAETKSSEKIQEEKKAVDPSVQTHRCAPSPSEVDGKVAHEQEIDTTVQTHATKPTVNVEDTIIEQQNISEIDLKSTTITKTKYTADVNTQDEKNNRDLTKTDTNTIKITQFQTTTENSTNTNRKKSWKANRAIDLRCAPPVAGLSGHRIIAPIDECSPRDSIQSTDSNLIPTNTRKAAKSVEGEISKTLNKEKEDGVTTRTTNPETNIKSNESKSSSKSANDSIILPQVTVGEYFKKDKVLCQRFDGTRKERGDEGVVRESMERKKQELDLPSATSGEGDGHRAVQDEVTNSKIPNTSTPKKSAVYKVARQPQEPGEISNRSTRRQLLGDKKVVPGVGTEFTAEDELIVKGFFDRGADCIESVVVDEVVINRTVVKPEHKVPAVDDNLAIYAKIADDNASMLREAFSKPLDGNKSFNSTFNTSYGSNHTGNDTRNLSDMSRSFTSYIETNNTMDFSSLEVKPGHGDRPNKKKLEAEIKPKKKKTRGTPNQHLDAKHLSKVKVKPQSSHGDCDKGKDLDLKEGSRKDSLKDDKNVASVPVSKSWTENQWNKAEKKSFDPKPMHYEQWQMIDQREINMVPDKVHYRNESKLKDVEEMYSVSSGRNKKKKKRREKKGKSANKDGTKGQSDDDEWFIE